jgi:hypothetical protein
MNVLAVLLIGGPLMAGLPAAADHPTLLLVDEPFLKVADNDDFAARKDAYLQKSGNEMAEWQRKMGVAGERTEAAGHEASLSTKAHLDRTWTATKQGWQELQAQSAEGWDKTKDAYERSTAELRVQWHRVHAEDKD